MGKLVPVYGSRRLILVGLVCQMAGFGILILGLGQSTPVLIVGLIVASMGSSLCLTPITSLAMTAVPPERAGMASGIMSAQRALGSTVGFAVLGSVLAAALTVTLSAHLAQAIPDPTERREVADAIMREGRVRRAWIGLEVQPLLMSSKVDRGALIGGTIEGSPAAAVQRRPPIPPLRSLRWKSTAARRTPTASTRVVVK